MRCDPEYLDRNYGGVFIVWDRMFGTFAPEVRRPRYGLTKPVDTYNIVRLQTHEYAAIARDVRAASSWRSRLGYVFGPPGWTPRRSPDVVAAQCLPGRQPSASQIPDADRTQQ